MSVNPFFEGDKAIERKLFEAHETKKREMERSALAENQNISPAQQQQNLQNAVEPTSFISFLLSCELVKFNCVWSRENFFQVFERGNVLSWFLPLGIKHNGHNGYEWNLKVYKTDRNANNSDDSNLSLINK